MPWTDIFPYLTIDHIKEYRRGANPEEKAELASWFRIAHRFNTQPEKDHIASFSIFWKNARASSPKFPRPTRETLISAHEHGLVETLHPWRSLIQPLLAALPALVEEHPCTCFRIYLANDLDFLIEDFVAAGCEVCLMEHSSICGSPGALWKYLACGERNKWVTILDNTRLNEISGSLNTTNELRTTGLAAWRVPDAADFSAEGNVCYRPLASGYMGMLTGIPVTPLLKAFVWNSRKNTLPNLCTVPDAGPKQVRGANWPDEGFDQWFLTTTLFPRLAARGMVSLLAPSFRSFFLPLDIEYVTWANPNSEIVYKNSPTPGRDGTAARHGSLPGASELRMMRTPPNRAKVPTSPCKLALMFLTKDGIHHPEIWQEYVDDWNGDCSVFYHSKTGHFDNAEFPSAKPVSRTIETKWGCVSLVQATLLLLEEAIKNPKTTHFALVSENCVPARPAAELRRALTMDPRPRINWTNLEEMRHQMPDKAGRIYSVNGIRDRYWHFHDQWWILDRAAVFAILQNDRTVDFSGSFAPDECYFGTVLALAGWNFQSDVIKRATTWTHWIHDGASPSSHDMVTGKEAAEISESGCFFARKFPKESNIGEWNLHRPAVPDAITAVPA